MMARIGDTATLSRISDVLGKKGNYSTKYKTRLLKRGIIQNEGGNVLSFALPRMRHYVLNR